MIKIEDQAILSTMIALFESFETKETDRLESDPEAKIVITGFNNAIFNNICLKKPQNQDKLIKELQSFQRHLAKPLMVWMTPETDSFGLEEKMSGHFDSLGTFHGMLLDVNKAKLTECPENIFIETVETKENATDYASLFCDVFQLHNTRETMRLWAIQQYQNKNSKAVNYIAKVDGQLAGIGTLILDHDFAQFKTGGFYNDGVLPQYRKFGVATALASHRVKEAKSLGLKYLSVILMSDAMARGYCERLGFKGHQHLIPFVLAKNTP